MNFFKTSFYYINIKTRKILAKKFFESKESPNDYSLKRLCFYGRIGLLYNRVQKNANTTVVAILSDLNGQSFQNHNQAKKKSEGIPFDALFKERLHTFVVIRNPYSRVLSAFLQKFTFRRDSYVDQFGSFEPTPDGFLNFIKYLKKNGISGDSHWDLQKKQIAYPLAQYNSVIKFENFAFEMGQMLKGLGLEHDPQKLVGLGPTDKGKQTQADYLLSKFYSDELICLVRELYADDFDFLGYEIKFPVLNEKAALLDSNNKKIGGI